MLKPCGPMVFAREAKRVDIVLTDISPILKGNAQFERALYGGQKILLFDF